MKNLEKMLIFLFINAITFYASAFFITDTWSWMLMLIFIIPIIVFISSLVFWGLTWFKKRINFLYPILTGIIFLPCVYIFYNDSGLVYVTIYLGIALLWMIIWWLFYKK